MAVGDSPNPRMDEFTRGYSPLITRLGPARTVRALGAGTRVASPWAAAPTWRE
jgi:hypothetical protein